MKFTLSWLKDFLDTNAGLEELSDKLTFIGLEVEEIVDQSKVLEPFTVAYVKSAKKHPNADNLTVCEVDTGSEILQIVCGAKNARSGIKVVLAKIGTVIPTNGMKMKPVKIRDVDSQGMMCAADEMGLEEKSKGIMELPEDAKLGEPFAKYVGAADPMIEIAITPNRGDCLGVYGIARDLAAAGLGKLKPVKIPVIKGSIKNSPISVQIKDNNCHAFVSRYFEGVKNNQSPAWMQKRLKAIGQNTISTLVDITNYFTHCFGRPLHVYDVDKLNGDLIVRKADNGETFLALNEKEYKCDGGELVISNDGKVVGFGGIIGESKTGCSENTTRVLLECALFDPINIAQTGRKHQVDTDARYRFERNVDPEFLRDGAELASQMIIDFCGGEASQLYQTGEIPSAQTKIILPKDFIEKRGGIEISDKEIIRILESLGFDVNDKKDSFEVKVPSWRSDVTIKEDLVEEVIRINGFDKIPSLFLPREELLPNNALSKKQRNVCTLKRYLASRGYFETVTWSFMDSRKAELFGKIDDKLRLQNPISSDLDYMRASIIPNLLLAAERNAHRGFNDLSLFEVGRVFEGTKPEQQKLMATGIRVGKDSMKNLYGNTREFDVFDAKSDMFNSIAEFGLNPENLQLDSDEAPSWYHPGRSAQVRLGKNIIGYFGELHPAILKAMGIKNNVVGFEIFIENLPEGRSKRGKKPASSYSDFQAVERDFAFLVSEDQPVEEIRKTIAGCDKNLIRNISIFDIYSGKNIEEGKKSVALSVVIQSNEKTLTDEEIDSLSNKIIDKISSNYKAELRA